MDVVTGTSPSKKARIPKACAACRKSKSATTCTWHVKTRSAVDERLERVEQAIWALNRRLDDQETICRQSREASGPVTDRTGAICNSTTSVDAVGTALDRPAGEESSSALPAILPPNNASFTVQKPARLDVVSSGLITDFDAQIWFNAFFDGCDRFVPIFDPAIDTYSSVRERSSVLFDVLITFGCKAGDGSLANEFRKLYNVVRQHISDITLHDTEASLESVQALLVVANYSESGAILCDIALRESLKLHLPQKVAAYFSSLAAGCRTDQPVNLRDLIPIRVFYGLVLLHQILSLDGGKPASMSLHSIPRRIRILIAQPHRTPIDLRLYAQVELNELRATSYAYVVAAANAGEQSLKDTIDQAQLDMSRWKAEWQALIFDNLTAEDEKTVFTVNLRIQHAWAVIALQLRALTASGVDNLALVTESQRTISLAAKTAAERHLDLILTNTYDLDGSDASHEQTSYIKPYIANIRYGSEFVFAKNAFCVLIVLRLAILLGDPLPAVLHRLQQAQDFLDGLSHAGMGANVGYIRILSQTVKKCQRAVKASQQAQDSSEQALDTGDADFQSFVPHEFTLKWDFPGLNLCYIPLDWQELFLNFEAGD
ncbi:hypothetical protein LTR02_005109 [Friedmanniomyces endolithicus]|nr:hypothetical protein LTR94_006586 [Friedmanniomyces endolithicus]KAK0795158.1 hypothetical protein LTR59_007553 [Friedmanniomyces endolithicus]KAK0802036.1 hypothetical protein LTR38_006611 [Friedmanniomyces endolithicus]KAK0820763.1 hypothetical protein LTR75_001349 [Friedmanniomyces endolithicus]KAK0853712.1 hypothetical protein LTR03_002674 [Friedmanniomyces endolithicus]